MNLDELTQQTDRSARVGIMGGTFDPIHYGHLLVAEEAFQTFQLDVVVFVPTGDSYHKKDRKVASAEHRYLMTLLATNSNPHFVASRMEIDRRSASYTVDTLKEMAFWFVRPAQFFFITGSDAVLTMNSWASVDELPDLCHIVAATRPGFELTEEQLATLPPKLQKSILPLSIPLTSISSTDIRRRIEQRLSIRYLLPLSVESYIRKMKLYDAVNH